MPRKTSAPPAVAEPLEAPAIEPAAPKQNKVPGTGSITEFEGADGALYRRIHVQKGPGRRAPWTDKTERIG